VTPVQAMLATLKLTLYYASSVPSVPLTRAGSRAELEWQIPGFLCDLVPQTRSTDPSFVISVRRNGKRIVLIKVPAEKELINTINAPWPDLLSRDYGMPQAKQASQVFIQIDEGLLGILSKLTPEELEELRRYTAWLISQWCQSETPRGAFSRVISPQGHGLAFRQAVFRPAPAGQAAPATHRRSAVQPCRLC